MPKLRAGLAICPISLATVAPACARDIPPKQQFVARLQDAVRTNDKGWLADHMRYPVRYFGRPKKLIRGKTWFLENYRSVIGAKLRAAVIAQDAAGVFENWQGMMVGGGRFNVWIRDISGSDGVRPRYAIIAINDPE